MTELAPPDSVIIFVDLLTWFQADLAAVLETAYTLKHVEHKAGSAIPFSIRQMGIYQNFNLATKTSSNILIQSSQNVQSEVLRLVQEGTMATFPDHWKNMHEIHLSSLSNNWIDYIKFLESKMSDIVRIRIFC